MGFEIDGLDELQNEFNQMAESSKELSETEYIDFNDLFTASFMQEHSKFLDFDEFLKAGNFIVNSQEDFEAIPDSELDIYTSKTTDFSSWEDMFGTAMEEYTVNKLGF